MSCQLAVPRLCTTRGVIKAQKPGPAIHVLLNEARCPGTHGNGCPATVSKNQKLLSESTEAVKVLNCSLFLLF